jgi:hypothetical protein
LFGELRAGLVVGVVAFSLMAGCAQASAAPRSSCASASAAGVVRYYYEALNQHRAAAAKACLTPGYLNRLINVHHVVDLDWKNVVSARVVKIAVHPVADRVLPADIRPAPFRAVQILAQVVERYRQVVGSANGMNTWFIYVVEQRATSPWRIAEIGSGP